MLEGLFHILRIILQKLAVSEGIKGEAPEFLVTYFETYKLQQEIRSLTTWTKKSRSASIFS